VLQRLDHDRQDAAAVVGPDHQPAAWTSERICIEQRPVPGHLVDLRASDAAGAEPVDRVLGEAEARDEHAGSLGARASHVTL
jgi:hypothetical protein